MTNKPSKWSPGRPKGAVNRKTKEFQEKLEERGFDLASTLCDLLQAADAEYKRLDVHDPIGRLQAIKVMADIVGDIASYSMPKLKAIEVHAGSPLEGMTAKEKLEVMKEATLLLEQQVKAEK